MKKYDLEYGDGTISIELDENNVIGELSGIPVKAADDPKKLLYDSLSSPIGREPLKDAVRGLSDIVIVISDMSRFWMRQDRVIPHLISYLNEAGVKDDQMTIVVANGTHLPGDEKELRTLVTDAVYDRIKVINHDCNADDLVYIGTTDLGTSVSVNKEAAQADLVICLGACTHHIMAGFGGGRKSILPGISSYETIQQNHSHSLDPKEFRSSSAIGTGKLEGNPVHEDMCRAASFMKNLYMINIVMNAEMELSSIFSGHYIESWLAGCREVDRIYRLPVKEKADVIVASCGGYPKDMSLYQGTKSIDNIEFCLKPGGTLILAIEARDGGGPAEYFDWLKNLLDGSIENRLRNAFTVAGYIFFLNCEQARRYNIKFISGIDPDLVKPMGIEAYKTAEECLAHTDISGKSVYYIPHAGTVVPVAEGM